LKYADGTTGRVLSNWFERNKNRISVYILGLEDKKYSPTYGKELGKASATVLHQVQNSKRYKPEILAAANTIWV
jgi:hypothetical protein